MQCIRRCQQHEFSMAFSLNGGGEGKSKKCLLKYPYYGQSINEFLLGGSGGVGCGWERASEQEKWNVKKPLKRNEYGEAERAGTRGRTMGIDLVSVIFCLIELIKCGSLKMISRKKQAINETNIYMGYCYGMPN